MMPVALRLLYFAFILSTVSAWSISLIFTFGVAPRSVTAAVGNPPTQKKASILRSLSALTDSATPSRSRLMSLSLSRPAASMTRNAITGGAAGRAGGDALALEVGHFLDPGAFDAHHVHAVRVEHHQRAHLDRAALELVLALERVERGVDHHERDLALLRADQFEIVDRAAGHARGRLHPGHVFGEHVRHAAAERVVDPAGAAGRDGDIEPLIGSLTEGRAGHRRRAHRERADHKSFAFHDGRPLPIARAGQRGVASVVRCLSRTAAPIAKPNVAV